MLALIHKARQPSSWKLFRCLHPVGPDAASLQRRTACLVIVTLAIKIQAWVPSPFNEPHIVKCHLATGTPPVPTCSATRALTSMLLEPTAASKTPASTLFGSMASGSSAYFAPPSGPNVPRCSGAETAQAVLRPGRLRRQEERFSARQHPEWKCGP